MLDGVGLEMSCLISMTSGGLFQTDRDAQVAELALQEPLAKGLCHASCQACCHMEQCGVRQRPASCAASSGCSTSCALKA